MTKVKEDIVREVQQNITHDFKFAKHLVETIITNIKESLEAGNDFMISGFGNFKLRDKAERIGRNPKTKIEYPISERRIVMFKTSKVFQQILNQP